MRRKLWKGALLLAFLSSSALAAEPAPKVGPAPAWVRAATIPQPDPKNKNAPLQMLSIKVQTKFDADRQWSHVEYVALPQTLAGLQGAGTVTLPWNVDRAGLTVNAIEIHRGGEIINLLKNADFTVLRREGGLENNALLDGVRTVVLNAKGLQIGDRLRVAATYDGKPAKAFATVEDVGTLVMPFELVELERRYIVAPGSGVAFKTLGTVPKPVVTVTEQGREYLFRDTNIVPAKYPTGVREIDKTRDIQFSAFTTWAAVAADSIAPYREARKIAPKSPLDREADKIAAASADPARRMLAALRLTQEQVRYVAITLGDGAYVPTSAADTWEQKFGDCKAKTAMLLGLLDRLGITAEAMYVNAKNGEVVGDRLPSLATFNHVIVRAEIASKAYYLDATEYGQRTIDDLAGSQLSFGLPIRAEATLEKLPPLPMAEPTRDTELVWDASRGITPELPFTARMTLRGVMAINARVKQQSVEKAEDLDEYFENLMPGVSNEALEIVSQEDDPQSGTYVITFKGKAKASWDEYEDMSGYRFSFDNNAASWTEDFERAEGAFKDLPVRLNRNFWQREVETMILPTGAKGYKVDAGPLDHKLAATHIWRTVTSAPDRITVTSNFKRLGDEMSAEEARRAVPILAEINKDFAYIVAPRGFRPPREVKQVKK